MRRTLFLLLAALAVPALAQDNPTYSAPADAPAASGARAEKGPDVVNPDAIKVQADDLHDAVANPSSTEGALHTDAGRLFESVQSETPLFRPAPHHMEREHVDGHEGTVDGMIAAAQQRWDHYKLHTKEVPAAELEDSIKFGRGLRDDGRVSFDKTGAMADNQMGVFRYAKESLTNGVVELNARMALVAARIGEAFAYATVVHEATHAKAREAGRLNPKDVIDGEVEAYRVQYRWIKALDPKAERLIVFHYSFGLWLKRHPDDKVTRLSLTYVDHLLSVYDTEGDDAKIKDLVKRLGYEDGDHDHDGGVTPGATPVRA